MFLYILLVAVANLGLGFAIAVLLARRASRLKASSTDWPNSTPVPEDRTFEARPGSAADLANTDADLP